MLDFTFVYYPIQFYGKSKIKYLTVYDEPINAPITFNHKDKSLSIPRNGVVTASKNVLTFDNSLKYDVTFENPDIASELGLGLGNNRRDTDFLVLTLGILKMKTWWKL